MFRMAFRRFALRQALPVTEVHLVQPPILRDRQRQALGQRLRRGDRAASRAGDDRAPGQGGIGIGKQPTHARARQRQRGVDVAAEPILPAELGFTVS